MARSTSRVLLVVLSVVTAGCQGRYGSAGLASDPQAVAAVTHAQQASHNVTSYRYTVDGQVRIRHDSQSESVAITGLGVVNGVETAVVTAHPTEQQLQTSHPLPPGTDVTRGGATVKNATVRAWIDTETGRLLNVQREIQVRGGGSTGVATITYHFSAYNGPTDITRPSFEQYGPQWERDCVEA